MGQNAGNGKAPEKVLILYKYETNTLKIRVRIINPSDFLILIRITMPRALSRRRLALRPVMPSAARGLRPLHPRKATAWAPVQTRRPAEASCPHSEPFYCPALRSQPPARTPRTDGRVESRASPGRPRPGPTVPRRGGRVLGGWAGGAGFPFPA